MPDTSTEHEGQAGEAKHSPLPWKIASRTQMWSDAADDLVDAPFVDRITGVDGKHVCGTCDGCNRITLADAEFMLRAVNAHDTFRTALVEAVDEQAMAVDAIRVWADMRDQIPAWQLTQEMRELADRLERDLDMRRKVLEVAR